MRKLCPLCGPKLSAFCMMISIWGVLFLGLLGIFFYSQAVTLFPELPFRERDEKEFSASVVEQKYSEKAIQCWIASGMYLVTLILVFWQNKYNQKAIF
uniref:Ribonuclease kappa n=1 Tax=Panagrolaimus sp. JU765 TaxID=591449 RepID=A0AC34QVA6_9BILA